jgi:hypothetical protein
MSSDNNVSPITSQKIAREIILTALIGAMSLAGAFGIAILIFSPENIAIGATLVGSAVTGPLAFIAGRKT